MIVKRPPPEERHPCTPTRFPDRRRMEIDESFKPLDFEHLRQDAARYRWLKSQPEFFHRAVEETGLSVDEAIDLMRSRSTIH